MMPADKPGIEGALSIRLTLAAGRVDRVDVRSSRPLGAARLFVGKPIDQVLTTIPLLYGVCATAQAAAAVQAAEQALGCCADLRQQRAREMLVLIETAREHLVRVLIGWNQWLGEQPSVDALRFVGRLKSMWTSTLYPDGDGFRPGGGNLALDADRLQDLIVELSDLLEVHVLGLDYVERLREMDADALVRWADTGGTGAARLLGTILEQGRGGLGRSEVPILGAVDPVEVAQRLDRQDADSFIAAPVWRGEPRETGALARERDAPLVRSLTERYGNGLVTRQAARLSELARLPGRLRSLLSAVMSDSENSGAILGPQHMPDVIDQRGLGIVEAARGVLVHRLALDGDRVRGYRILAPTEWNFRADGALARGLCGLQADAGLRRLVSLLVDAIDPCVGYQLEVVD